MSATAMNEWQQAARRKMISAMPDLQEMRMDQVLADLAFLRADVSELKRHMMGPSTALITGAQAVEAFRRLREGGAA